MSVKIQDLAEPVPIFLTPPLPPVTLDMPSAGALAYAPPAGDIGVPALPPDAMPGAIANPQPMPYGCPRTLQWMPNGLIYRSYMAGVREPRIASVWSSEKDFGAVWDIALGGRIGVLRYGSVGGACPEGWQFDVEGAAFPRLDPDGQSTPLISTDYRAGLWLTHGRGPWHFKTGYYHISAHLGDEFLLRNPTFPRINYTRDAVVFGAGYYWTDALRLYGEVGYAVGAGGGAQPWETQFGIDFSPPHTPPYGSPFGAVNAHLRQEVGFGGNFVVQGGWQWRQGANGRLLRFGFQYFNGMSDQYEFFDDYESKVGGGVWFDY